MCDACCRLWCRWCQRYWAPHCTEPRWLWCPFYCHRRERQGRRRVYSVCDVMTEQSWIRNGHRHLSKQGEFPALACSSTSEDLGSDGKIHIDTSFSRLLGKPPVMVARMTPATVKAGFVSAVLYAGYHVELAGWRALLPGSPTCQSCGDPEQDLPWHWSNLQLTLHKSTPVLSPAPALAGDAP
jgi:hypothetical protein